jgi:hypothetical protein
MFEKGLGVAQSDAVPDTAWLGHARPAPYKFNVP